MTATRRRGLLLLCFALVCGGLAAAQVQQRERRADDALGPVVGVVVAERDLPADGRLRPGDLAVRRVPARFAPPDAVPGSADLGGARTVVAVPRGAYLTAAMLGTGARGGPRPLRPGERELELPVAGGAALVAGEPGAHVDVVVTTGTAEGGGRAYVALEDVELLGLRAVGEAVPGADEAAGPVGGEAAVVGDAATAATALATLRVTARQAVYLTAAANVATEVRLLVRPPGDRRRVGSAAVDAGAL
jgi:pilus assembly protein CpaB